MARGFTIKETDILALLIEEFNDNAFAGVIEFSLGDWLPLGENEDGTPKGLLINRYSFNNQGRFDLKTTYNELTYAETKSSYVAMSVGSLNGEFTALETIKDVVYSTVVEFLVCADNLIVQKAITLAIEEVRKRFIQYNRKYDVSYMDIENKESTDRVTETLKLVFTADTIDYGTITQINGKQYLSYSLPITMRATNFGVFANQQKVYLGVDSILDSEDDVEMFLLEPDEWDYGIGAGIESTQLLVDKANAELTNAKEIKSIYKNKAWNFSLDVQIDLQDPTNGKILRHLYKRSLQEHIEQDIYTVKIETYLFNYKDWESSNETYWNEQEESNRGSYTGDLSDLDANSYSEGFAMRVTDGSLPETYTYHKIQVSDYAIDNDLTTERKMIATLIKPNETLSKGDKIVYTVILTPYYQELS